MRALKRLWNRRTAYALLAAGVGAATAVALGLWTALRAQLPAIYSIADYRPPSASRVISADGHVIGTFAYERRTPVAIESLPAHVRFAFLAAEDADFYRHEGIDWWGVLRALGKNLRPGAHLQGASTITQQTVKTLVVGPERSLWRKLREAILARRLEQLLGKDAILGLYLNQIYFGHGAWGIEEAARASFDKPAARLDVLEAATLASAPKHPGRYALDGDREALQRRRRYVLLQMAAHHWLDRDEALRLSTLPLPAMAPANPWPAYCRAYVEHVRRLLTAELGEEALFAGGLTISVGLEARAQRAAMVAVRQSLEDVGRRRRRAPKPWLHFEEEQLARLLPAARRAFARRPRPEGCTGCPTAPFVWSWRQVLPAEPGLELTLASLPRAMVGREVQGTSRVYWPVTRRAGHNGAVMLDTGSGEVPLSPADMAWVRRPRGRTLTDVGAIYGPGDVLALDVSARVDGRLDVRLAPRTEAQAALVAIDPRSHFVRALVGAAPGSSGTGFNRATQARRQPGSAFKPILYAAALEGRFITPASLCDDAPVEIPIPHSRRVWRPENYEDGHYDGPITFRTALARSKNTCSVRLLQEVGIDRVRSLAAAMGIDGSLPNNLPLALGTGEVTPLALTRAMATLAAGGRAAAARYVERVVDAAGTPVWAPPPAAPEVQALAPEVAFVATSMLESVIEDGTGRRARLLARPLAGKTGTSQDARDVWFTGYGPTLAASVWMGHDDNASLGRETGASAALPAWIRFMGAALSVEPAAPFAEPPHVMHARVDAATGAPVAAVSAPAGAAVADETKAGEGIDEVFVEGTEPGSASAPLPSIFLQDEEPAAMPGEAAEPPKDVVPPPT